MSDFYDSLRAPSWKGFEFALNTDSKDFGRDVKKHKIINGKTVSYEDTGAKENAFTIEAVIGGSADFKEQADEFEALLSAEGTGLLILPHTDELKAVVTSARRRHNSDEVGVVYFSITFETVDQETKAPAGVSNTYELLASVNNSNDAAISDFVGKYTDTTRDFITNEIISQMDDFKSLLNGNLSRFNNAILSNVFTVSTGAVFGNEIISMFKDLVSFKELLNFSVAIDKKDAAADVDYVSVTKALNIVASSAPILDSEDQSLGAKNIRATDLFSRISAANAAAEASLSTEYESQKQALNIRAGLLSTIAGLRNEVGEQAWSDSYIALGDLMAGINRDIDNKLGRLPIVAIIKTQKMRSALAIAHQVFGDNPARVVAQANDLIKRNDIIHPSFVSASELEVLIDA